jgi:hypothetical protein
MNEKHASADANVARLVLEGKVSLHPLLAGYLSSTRSDF